MPDGQKSGQRGAAKYLTVGAASWHPFRTGGSLKKLALALVLASAGASAIAQNPDVLIHVDLVPTYRLQSHRQNFQWYDTLGHYSTVSLGLSLEPGFKA